MESLISEQTGLLSSSSSYSSSPYVKNINIQFFLFSSLVRAIGMNSARGNCFAKIMTM
jgi:hypothetical protein